jgi:hypothetical protein
MTSSTHFNAGMQDEGITCNLNLDTTEVDLLASSLQESLDLIHNKMSNLLCDLEEIDFELTRSIPAPVYDVWCKLRVDKVAEMKPLQDKFDALTNVLEQIEVIRARQAPW